MNKNQKIQNVSVKEYFASRSVVENKIDGKNLLFSKLNNTSSQKPVIKGITKRWATNTLLITALILLVLVTACIFFIVEYYRNYVTTYLSGYANESVTTYFTPYVNGSDEVFKQKAKEFADNFSDKSRVEVQVIDKYGNVSVSTSGFGSTEKMSDMEDVNEAVKSSTGICRWFGFNQTGEHIVSVAMALPLTSDGGFSGAVRFITSMQGIDNQIVGFCIILIFVYLVALFFVALSGIFFIQTIVSPLQKINHTAKLIAEGNYDVRIETGSKEEDEISDLAESINAMISDVAVTDKMKNDFISTVSHELRTPLTAIKGWAETLSYDVDKETISKGVRVIRNETERLSEMVEELLDFSRMQSGKFSLRIEKMDLLAELGDAVLIYAEKARRENIRIIYNEPEMLPFVNGDRNRIRQVFINIIDNAIKYSNPGSVITIGAEAVKNKIQVLIADNGVGISKQDLPRVKTKFFKANQTRRGSGIGLAVADEIITMHGGYLRIDSELGKGTSVLITLPCAVESVQSNERKQD